VGIDSSAYIHPLAAVIGDVTLGARTSVWPGAVIRADSASIIVGADCNVQDGAVLHVDQGFPLSVGARVSIGHRAVLHGATVEDDCLIGMGAVVLNRVVVGRGSIVGAGAVCGEGMVIPPDSVVLGVPGRVVRETTPDERERIRRTVSSYVELQERHRRGEFPAAAAASLGATAPGGVGGGVADDEQDALALE
jgi:carbonic anhydrase/acetyltransferase-like protein (isoleucine patch superfamily)